MHNTKSVSASQTEDIIVDADINVLNLNVVARSNVLLNYVNFLYSEKVKVVLICKEKIIHNYFS